jgi:hypothetical protein
LLDTLLECAPSDRRRPTPRECANLLRHGVRARLGRPGSAGVVGFAVFVALVGAFFGAAAANRLSWEAMPPLPSGAAATEISGTVFPDMRVWGGGDAEKFVEQSDGEGYQFGYALYWVKHTPATRDARTFSEGARDRLRAAGWRIRSEVVPDVEPGQAVTFQEETNTGSFWATRGDLVLDFSDFYWPGRPSYDSDGAAMFTLYRTDTSFTLTITALGGLLGALLGWLLTGWVSRRTERTSAASVAQLAAFALILTLPAILLSLGSVMASQEPPIEPFWEGLAYLGRYPAMIAGVLAAVVGCVAAWQPPRPSPFGWLRARPTVAAVCRPLARLSRHLAWVPERFARLSVRSRHVAISTAGALVLVAAISAVLCYDQGVPGAGVATCDPSGPPPEPDPDLTHLSRVAKVFVSIESTDEQVDMVQAAIGRVTAFRGFRYTRDTTLRDFRTTYCGALALSQAKARTLPWYFTVWFASPGAFPALVAEVRDMPGVLAVRHAPRGST